MTWSYPLALCGVRRQRGTPLAAYWGVWTDVQVGSYTDTYTLLP